MRRTLAVSRARTKTYENQNLKRQTEELARRWLQHDRCDSAIPPFAALTGLGHFMKIPLILFGILIALLAVMMFGAIGLSRLVRWLGWPQDVFVPAGMLFLFLAGICLGAWRVGVMEDQQKRRAEDNAKVNWQNAGVASTTINHEA